MNNENKDQINYIRFGVVAFGFEFDEAGAEGK